MGCGSLHCGPVWPGIQPSLSPPGRLRLRNCHGVAGLPCRSTHRFAPQAQSSMSSPAREGASAGCFSRYFVPVASVVAVSLHAWAPSPVPADLFTRAGGRGRTGGSHGAGDGAVRLCRSGGFPVWQGWCVGWMWLLSPVARPGCRRTGRRVTWLQLVLACSVGSGE